MASPTRFEPVSRREKPVSHARLDDGDAGNHLRLRWRDALHIGRMKGAVQERQVHLDAAAARVPFALRPAYKAGIAHFADVQTVALHGCDTKTVGHGILGRFLDQ